MTSDLKRFHLCLPTDTTDRLRWETRAGLSTIVRASLDAFEQLMTKSPNKAQKLILKHQPMLGRLPVIQPPQNFD